MESMKLESVTFYQSVLLNSKGENTVHHSLRGQEKTQCAFADDKVFIRNPNWQKASKDKIVVVGLHNVRHLSINLQDFINSPYGDVFKCFKTEVSEDGGTVHLTNEVPELEEIRAELDDLGIIYDKRLGVNKLLELKEAQLNQ
mgnify:CR=1 FL=1